MQNMSGYYVSPLTSCLDTEAILPIWPGGQASVIGEGEVSWCHTGDRHETSLKVSNCSRPSLLPVRASVDHSKLLLTSFYRKLWVFPPSYSRFLASVINLSVAPFNLRSQGMCWIKSEYFSVKSFLTNVVKWSQTTNELRISPAYSWWGHSVHPPFDMLLIDSSWRLQPGGQ